MTLPSRSSEAYRCTQSRSRQMGLVHHALMLTAVLALYPTEQSVAQSAGETAKALTTTGQRVDGDFFERSIRPILLNRCLKCHGPEDQQGELRLDSAEGLSKGGEHGPVITKEAREKSRLLHAVKRTSKTPMPPDEPLPAHEVELLEQWVLAGAPWPTNTGAINVAQRKDRAKTHWAFQPLRQPSIPTPKQKEWCQNPIDHFVLAKLEQKGLSPSPPADRRTLYRRMSYGLTGLPPSHHAIEQFVADRSANATSALVERLLASPAYGEHWARHWLDLARYSDTKGYVYDREERLLPHAWAYRDWVVEAFQQDMPYDRFLQLQLAADSLTPGDPSSARAMGFLTIGKRFTGVTHDVIDDRIDTVMRTMQGLTVSCARCHDHKFDPIDTTDYYSLYSIFLNSTERWIRCDQANKHHAGETWPDLTRVESASGIASPGMQIENNSTKPGDADRDAFEAELSKRQKVFTESYRQKADENMERVRTRIADYLMTQTELSRYPQEGFDIILKKTDILPGVVRQWERYLFEANLRQSPFWTPWLRYFELHQQVQNPNEFKQKSPALASSLQSSDVSINPLIAKKLSPPVTSINELAQHYAEVISKARPVIDKQRKTPNATTDRLASTASHQQSSSQGRQTKELPADQSEYAEIADLLYGAHSPCVIPDVSMYGVEFLFDTASCDQLFKQQGEIERLLIQSANPPPSMLMMVDRVGKQTARVFKRGNPALKTELVPARYLAFFSHGPTDQFSEGSGRREWAERITDPRNPLTARVWVNRIWQYHFGKGLVTTSSDFGLRAEPPSHPELLDWLADQLIKSNWSTKAIHRLILNSRTYQQMSTIDHAEPSHDGKADLLDPENRLLSRRSPHRMSFEEFRDTLLTVSNQLDPRIGGKPSILFEGDPLANRRRTIYGFIDRQFLPSVMRAFDFANPDLHIAERSQTTVAGQALFGLNHPLIAEIAKSVVSQMPATARSDPNLAAVHLFRTLLQREPSAAEQQTIVDSYQKIASLTKETKPVRPETLAWQYGYGHFDEKKRKLAKFHPLPYFGSNGWSGGASYPDAKLGWVALNDAGGHPGDDQQHAVVRRWTAPADGDFAITSTFAHETHEGNGVRAWIFSGKQGVLRNESVHHRSVAMNVDRLTLKKGEHIDFIVDINGHLNNDQFLWSPVIRKITPPSPESAANNVGEKRLEATAGVWDAKVDFAGPTTIRLAPWEQITQVLLLSNEFMFID